jgi:hypothetical protein
MRKLTVVFASGAIALLACADFSATQAADLMIGADQRRAAKVHRMKVVHDPCLRARQHARYADPYQYDRPNLVYVHGNSYRAGFCIDGDQGPAYRPFWAWGY